MERFTISLEDKLAREFDEWIAARGYSNRSEAVRDLLRGELSRTLVETAQSLHCVACLSYVFNHHERDLTERLARIQHEHHDLTVSAMHAHLDHDHCLETVILKGPTASVQKLSDAICAERGVHHGKLNLISVELHAPHSHGKGSKRAANSKKSRGAEVAPHFHVKPSH
jgi:CopG family nickel-responsive transcriptional regulator